MANHIIHQQRVVLKTPNNGDATALQNRLSSLLQNEWPGEIEKLLDDLSPYNEVIRIGSLELDLGELPVENFETGFKDRLLEGLKSSILNLKKVSTPGYENGAVESEATILSPVQSQVAAFRYFLENGSLPWYKAKTHLKAWEAEMTEQFTITEWAYIRQRVVQKAGPASVSLRRLTSQFSDTFLQHFTAMVPVIFSSSEWNEVYAALLQTGCRTVSLSTARHQLWAAAIMTPLHEISKTKVVQHLLQAMATGLQVPLREIINATETEALQSPLVQEACTMLLKETVTNQAEASFLPNNKPLSQNIPNVQPAPEETNPPPNAADSPQPQNATGENAPKTTGKHIALPKATHQPEAIQYVSNCGIVLLHPFLEMYFTELELVQQKVFVNEEARQRSVLLLHYLTTGETEAAEFNLILQKLLCGLASEETLPAQIELTEKEAQESEQLLQSAINYWSPLKNTSPKGLQHTFLQRQGRLEGKENGWLLTVEQKTVDILLSQLPWGFSTIRLPWMNGILNVEWA